MSGPGQRTDLCDPKDWVAAGLEEPNISLYHRPEVQYYRYFTGSKTKATAHCTTIYVALGKKTVATL